jgi:hypothetical protein
MRMTNVKSSDTSRKQLRNLCCTCFHYFSHTQLNQATNCDPNQPSNQQQSQQPSASPRNQPTASPTKQPTKSSTPSPANAVGNAPPASYQCVWPANILDYTMITNNDASSAAHMFYTSMAIGGKFYDASVGISSPTNGRTLQHEL